MEGSGRGGKQGRTRGGGGQTNKTPGNGDILRYFRATQTPAGHPHAAQGSTQHGGRPGKETTRGIHRKMEKNTTTRVPSEALLLPRCRRPPAPAVSRLFFILMANKAILCRKINDKIITSFFDLRKVEIMCPERKMLTYQFKENGKFKRIL